MGLCGLGACSYIFDLPEQPVVFIDGGLRDTGTPPIDAGFEEEEPLIDAEPPPPFVRFCERDASPFLYCADFDDNAPLDLPSIGTVSLQGGQLLLSSAVAYLSPRSILAQASGAGSSATVMHALGSDPNGVTFSFRQLVSAWSTDEARLSRIGLAGCSITLVGTSTTWALKQLCPSASDVTTNTASPVVRGSWQHFAIAIRFEPTPTITLDIDDTRAAQVAAVPDLVRGPVSIGLGVTRLVSGSVAVFQDDLLVTSP
jgi:hypothetical protein